LVPPVSSDQPEESPASSPPPESPPPVIHTPEPPSTVSFSPPPVISQPPPVIISSPSPPVLSTAPMETAYQVQDRVVKDDQIKEVKRVRRTYKTENAVGVLFGAIEGSLAIRLAFKLFGANDANGFVNLLYQFTGIFAGPFDGIFGRNPIFGSFELDLASIIGMIIYALVGFGAIKLAKLF